MPDIDHLVDGDCGIVLDDRYFPLVVSTWYGDPGEAIVRRYFVWLAGIIERSRKAGTPYVLVTDATYAKRPKPSVRQVVAELTDALPDDTAQINIGNYVVVESALIRGALTAMQWISRQTWKSETVPSCEEALRRGFADLRQAGQPIPEGLSPESYVRPQLRAS